MALRKNPWASESRRRLDAMAPCGVHALRLLEPVLFDHEAEAAGGIFRLFPRLRTHVHPIIQLETLHVLQHLLRVREKQKGHHSLIHSFHFLSFDGQT